jgi:hypothetical protein
MSGVDPGVDPTQTPGVQSPPEEEGPPAWTTLFPPPLEQADMAELNPMIAQMLIAAGTLVMMFGLSSSTAINVQVNRLATAGFVTAVFTPGRMVAAMNRNRRCRVAVRS